MFWSGGLARRAKKGAYQVKPEPQRKKIIAGPKSYHGPRDGERSRPPVTVVRGPVRP